MRVIWVGDGLRRVAGELIICTRHVTAYFTLSELFLHQKLLTKCQRSICRLCLNAGSLPESVSPLFKSSADLGYDCLGSSLDPTLSHS